MDIEKVRALVNIMEGNNINTLELTEGDMKIRLEKGSMNNSINVVTNEAVPTQSKNTEVKKVTESLGNIPKIEVRSPMVGVFYKASSPDANPFVKVGSKVKKGDVLCIIEAMKLMNEIYAEQDGEIAEICINDGDIVEYSQVLFRMN